MFLTAAGYRKHNVGMQKADSFLAGSHLVSSVNLYTRCLQVVYMTSQPRIMGKMFTSSKQLQVVIWILVASILAINAYMVVSVTESLFGNTWWVDMCFVTCGLFYYSFVAYLSIGPDRFYDVIGWLREKGQTVFSTSAATLEI